MITSTIITIIGLIGSLITIYREIYPKDKHQLASIHSASGGLVQGFAPKPLKPSIMVMAHYASHHQIQQRAF